MKLKIDRTAVLFILLVIVFFYFISMLHDRKTTIPVKYETMSVKYNKGMGKTALSSLKEMLQKNRILGVRFLNKPIPEPLSGQIIQALLNAEYKDEVHYPFFPHESFSWAGADPYPAWTKKPSLMLTLITRGDDEFSTDINFDLTGEEGIVFHYSMLRLCPRDDYRRFSRGELHFFDEDNYAFLYQSSQIKTVLPELKNFCIPILKEVYQFQNDLHKIVKTHANAARNIDFFEHRHIYGAQYYQIKAMLCGLTDCSDL